MGELCAGGVADRGGALVVGEGIVGVIGLAIRVKLTTGVVATLGVVVAADARGDVGTGRVSDRQLIATRSRRNKRRNDT